MTADLITAEVKALIGVWTDWVEACDAVQSSEIRRFIQGAMEPRAKRLGLPAGEPDDDIAPTAFAVHMFRHPITDATDPLAAGGDADFDGAARRLRADLPPIPVGLARVVNGGYGHEFYSHLGIGERVVRRSRYKDIYQRDGKTGPMVFVVVEDEYRASDGRPLQLSTNTQIIR